MARRVISRLSIQVGADSEGLKKDFGKVEDQARGLGRSISRAGREVDTVGDKFARLARRVLTAAALISSVSIIGGLAGEAETVQTRLKVMLGDAQAAARLMAEINAFAASTPFQKMDLAGAAAKLLAFGVGAEDVMDRLKILGDVAAGSGARIAELASIFGKARSSGTVALGDLNQLGDRAIPIFETLKTQLGKSGDELKKFVSTGQLKFPDLLQALRSMTEQGGLFFQAMQERSETLQGVLSTLKDNVEALATSIGVALLPFLKAAANGALALAQALGSVDTATIKTVAQIAAFTAGLLLALKLIPKIIAAFRAIRTAIKAMTAAQVIANSVTLIGAAKTAAALAVGAAAAWGVSKAFDAIEDSAKGAEQAAAKAAGAGEKAAAPEIAEGLRAQADAAADAKKAAEEARKEMEKWAQIGERLTKAARTPMERLKDTVAEAAEALRRGVISWETYRRTVEKAADDLLKLEEKQKRVAGGSTIAAVSRDRAGPAIAAAVRTARGVKTAEAERKREADRRDKLLADLLKTGRDTVAAIKESKPVVRRHSLGAL